jgi:hypothetical protein
MFVVSAPRGGRRILGLAAMLILSGACAPEKAVVEPPTDDTHVSGTLTAIEDQRPVDGGVLLTVLIRPQRSETLFVPSLFTGEPPTTRLLALQQKVNAVRIGDRLTATGKRDATGRFIVEVIANLRP